MSTSSTVKLGLLPAIGLLATAGAGYLLFTSLPIDSYLNHISSCDIPARKQLPTDITHGRFPQVDNVLCAIAPLYDTIPNNRMTLGAASLVLSVLVPVTLRQGYLASSPNHQSALLGPVTILVLQALGQAIGHGFAFATVGTASLALGMYQQAHSPQSTQAIPLVPTPAGSIYWINLSVMILSLSAVAQGLFSKSGAYGQGATILFLLFPLYFAVFLLLAALGVKAPASDRQARAQLMTYSAEQVSYAFERTWSYYRKAALASMSFYWFGMHRFIT